MLTIDVPRHSHSAEMIEDPVRRTAVHESGHAIVAIVAGVRFEAVELHVDAIDGYWYCGGRLRGAELPEDADHPRLWAQLVIIMAGYAAVSLLAPPRGFSMAEFKAPDDRDFAAAADILHSMSPPLSDPRDRETAMEEAWRHARQVVADNWPRMAAIADELVRLSHRSGELEACHIVLTPKDISRILRATT